jgi:putative acetyltransferase
MRYIIGGKMVILIGGVGCVGKTLLAQKLLEMYKIPYFSIDHLKMGIYRSDAECGFTPESPDELITEKLWPIIKGIIMTNIENNQNIIIEGVYFPKSISELDKEYLEKIIFFNIGFSEEYIGKNLFEKIMKKRNIIEKRGYNFEETIEKYVLENKIKKELSIKNGIKYFEIEGNYDKEMKYIYKWIEEEIRKL